MIIFFAKLKAICHNKRLYTEKRASHGALIVYTMVALEWMNAENGDYVDSWLKGAIEESGFPLESESLAEWLDVRDSLYSLRNQFHIPQHPGEAKPAVYLLGNSLGLQPRSVQSLLFEELDVWARRAEDGHFDHPYGRPWLTVDEECARLLLPLVGAHEGEVAVMGSLTNNLHLLFCAFYHPSPQRERYKILLEQKAFPSDHVCHTSFQHPLVHPLNLPLPPPVSASYSIW